MDIINLMRSTQLNIFIALFIFPLASNAQIHYKLSPDWVTGEGIYVVVDEVEFWGIIPRNNRVLVVANIDGSTNPLHAWINRDFGTDYTVRCDVQMESWLDLEDLSRGGIAARLQPAGSNEGAGQDRAINLLYHENFNTIEYLNDFRAWSNTDENQFTWEKGVMHTLELTVSGNQVSGKIHKTHLNPNTGFQLETWTHDSIADRSFGFPGITGSNVQGQVVVFDNFAVIVDRQTVFFDDFEGELETIPQTVGLSGDWVSGEGGYWIVNNGVLYGIATSRLDPKKIWHKQEIIGGASIHADVQMLSWHHDAHIPGSTADYSRAGVSLHIQPEGREDGRTPGERGPGEARGVSMLLHENTQTVEFLNDFVAWSNLDDNTIPWEVGKWYTFDFRSDGFVVEGTFMERDNPSTAVELRFWAFPGVLIRFDGFAGLAASTVPGEVAAYDNVEIYDEEGGLIFSDNFDTAANIEHWSIY